MEIARTYHHRDVNIIREGETPAQKGIVTKFDRDRIEAYKEATYAQTVEDDKHLEAPPAPEPPKKDDGFSATDFLPFGIGYWMDGKDSFADDLGKTILSIVIPIPIVGGLIADAVGPWFGNAIVDVAEWGAGAVKDTAEWVGEAAEDTTDWIGDAAGDAADWAGEAAGDVVDTIGDGAEAVGDFLGDLW